MPRRTTSRALRAEATMEKLSDPRTSCVQYIVLYNRVAFRPFDLLMLPMSPSAPPPTPPSAKLALR